MHTPSGLRLPREIRGPDKSHDAEITAITPYYVDLAYGPIQVRIMGPRDESNPVIVPDIYTPDPDPPSLPSLLFWGEGIEPVTDSYLNLNGGRHKGDNWMRFTIAAESWQIILWARYETENRETVIRTAEAVWAFLASANAEPPRRPPSP